MDQTVNLTGASKYLRTLDNQNMVQEATLGQIVHDFIMPVFFSSKSNLHLILRIL